MGRFNWGPEGPPEEAYSRVTDPERFAPLHPFALRLIDQLVRDYKVQPSERPQPSFELGAKQAVARPTVVLTPDDRAAAPIEIVFTDFPGLTVRLGRDYREHYPQCGCDACDETAKEQAEEFDWHARQVVAGRFIEASRDEAEFWDPSGRRSRRGDAARLESAGVHWKPWSEK
jgi:hypothetical protein